MSELTPRLRELFESALDLSPAERSHFLRGASVDPADIDAVERLLAADAREGNPWTGISVDGLSESIGELDADLSQPWTPGRWIGDYELIEPIGEGGSSTVFLAARDLDGARQQVALKLMRRGLHSPETRRLLRRERRALVALSHPNIAHLIDGGVTEAGLPYLVMEHVDGVPITQFAIAADLDVRALLQLMTVVCRAVAVAHRNLIVHRDLKPSNILVASDGTVKLLDFGIAKLLDDDLADATGAGYTPMTPGYAAPEQFSSGVISTATDVYSLGVLLHELLLRERPAGRFVKRPSLRVLGMPTDRRPARPSSQTLRRTLAGDLDTIVMKALAEEPERRYAGAADMADDIGRFLDGHPVRAHPPSPGYRARKFLSRHRGAALATLALIVVVLSSLAAALWQARAVRRQADIAAHEAQRANAVRGFLEDLFQPISEGVAERQVPSVNDLVGKGIEKLDTQTDLAPAERVDLLTMFARLSANLGDDARAVALASKADALAATALPASHPAAIGARVLLARHALNRDDYVTAEATLRDALERVTAGGGANRAAIEILDQLAEIETKHDRREQALALEREALAERIRVDGPDAKSVADGYANVAAGLTNLGRFDEAAEGFRRSAENDRVNRAPGSYDALSTLSNWGAALQVAGHIRAALDKYREAEEGFAALGGKPRRMRAVNLQKLCVTESAFADAATAAASCARLLEVTRDVAGDASKLMAFALRTEASRLIETGDLDGAATRLDEALQRLPDTPGNQEAHAVMRYVRASLDWLRGDAAAARADARWAIDHISGLAILWGARLSARTTLLLACADGPHPECGASPRADLEGAIGEVQNRDDPRLLSARVALARQDLERNPAAAALAIETAMTSAADEMPGNHPMIAAAQVWRALALDRAGRCVAAAASLQAADAAAAGRTGYPWLAEAKKAYLRDKRC